MTSVPSADEPTPPIAAAVIVHDGKVLLVKRRVAEGKLSGSSPPARSKPASPHRPLPHAKLRKRPGSQSSQKNYLASGSTRQPTEECCTWHAVLSREMPPSWTTTNSANSHGARSDNSQSTCPTGCSNPSKTTSTPHWADNTSMASPEKSW